MENKTLQLEIQLKHIAQTFKPLMNENFDLKDTLIDQNRYISDCKALLVQLLDDKDPDGNDRSIIKAIGDLSTICHILVDEFNSQRQKIRLQELSNQALKEQLKQEYENLRQRDSRLADEQKNFQLQINLLQQKHKEEDTKVQKEKQRLYMKIEDHVAAYQRLFDKYSHVKQDFDEQLAESNENYELAINNLKYTLEEKIKTYENMLEHIRREYVDIMMKREDQFIEQVKNHEYRITQINSEWLQRINSVQVENKSLKQLQEEQTKHIKNLTQQIREKDTQIAAKVNQITALTYQLTESRLKQAEFLESQRLNQTKQQNQENIKKEQVTQNVKTSPDETIKERGRARQSVMFQPTKFNKTYNMTAEKGRSTQNKKSSLSQSIQESPQVVIKKVDKSTQSDKVNEVRQQDFVDRTLSVLESQQQDDLISQQLQEVKPQLELRFQELSIQCDLITEEDRYKKLQQMIERISSENEEQKTELRSYYEKGRRTLQSAVEMWKNQLKEKQIRVNQLEEIKLSNEEEIKRLTSELEKAQAEIIQVDGEKQQQWKDISKEKEKLNEEFQKYQQQNDELAQLKQNFEQAQEALNQKLWTSVQQQENLQTEYDKKCEELKKYRSDLIKAYEMVKYLQLEVENYKKVHNMFKPNSSEQLTGIITDSNQAQPPQSPHKDQMKAIKTQMMTTIERATANTQERKPHSLSFHHQKHRMRPARTMQLSFNLHNVGIKDRNSPPADRLTKFAFSLNEQQAKREANLPKIYRYYTDMNEDTRVISSSEDVLIMQASENLLLNMFARSPTPTLQKMTKKKRSPRYTSK